MAKFFTRRVAAIAGIVLAGGAVAAGVAEVINGGPGSAASSSGGGSPVATMPVVRTTLTTTVQEGGSIGYSGSYTIAAPLGASASTVALAQQAVTEDQQVLSADKQAKLDASAASGQAIAAARANVNVGQSTLSADQSALTTNKAKETKACAGKGASTAACSKDTQQVSQDKQKVSTDQTHLTQDKQQLATAQSTAKTDDDQYQAKVGADKVKMQGDQVTLASERATAVNPGTIYTWLPSTGEVIRQDQPVYSVSDVPVPLLYGSVAAYRAFYAGMSNGGDVGELTHDLIALGYGRGLPQSDHYSAATAAAVKRWQKARGLPATGEILLGEVVFEPGPIRVTSVMPSPAAPAGGGGGTVLTATGITPVVTVDLDVTQEYMVKPGDAVSVVLPGSTTVGGRVKSVGTVATCQERSGVGGGSPADRSPCSSTGSSGSNSGPTVTVTITLDGAPPGVSLDQVPVNVNITTQTAPNVLAVPVNALLALAGGGYGVDVVAGKTSHLVGVTAGLYSNALVQVSGSGIAAGMRVEVPSS
jgi:peptidoglycan hydrolase-like protein with peptidoglycan-binding domain